MNNHSGYYGGHGGAPKNKRPDSGDSFHLSFKQILMIALLLLLLANVIITAVGSCGGRNKDEDANIIDSSGIPGDTVTDMPEEYIDTGTAFSHIYAATGTYAEVIDRFVEYERSVMQSDEIVLSFVGDCTLGTWPGSNSETNYNTIYENSGSPTYSFDLVSSLFINDDYSYINLETTLTDSTRPIENKTYNFKGDMEWAANMIAPGGIDGCNLANNHCYDWGEKSYHDTVDAVKNSGMDVGDEDNVIVKQLGNVEVVLLSCNYIPNGNYTYTDGRVKVYGDELTADMVQQINKHKRDDNIVIVNAHWGIEREHIPEAEQYESARKFIDAGADMVMGHHPHTLQSVELYKDKYIFYSIGNFAFGGKGTTDEVNRISLMVRPRFALRDGVAQLTGLMVVPCYTTSAADIEINNYQPYPLWGSEAKALVDKTIDLSANMKYGVTELECPTALFTDITVAPPSGGTADAQSEISSSDEG